MDNVIPFPKEKLNCPPQSLEETMDRIVKNRITYSQEFCSGVLNVVASMFDGDAIDIEDGYFAYDLELLKDALISLHMKGNNVGYYIQDVARNMYGPRDEDMVDVEELLEEAAE